MSSPLNDSSIKNKVLLIVDPKKIYIRVIIFYNFWQLHKNSSHPFFFFLFDLIFVEFEGYSTVISRYGVQSLYKPLYTSDDESFNPSITCLHLLTSCQTSALLNVNSTMGEVYPKLKKST